MSLSRTVASLINTFTNAFLRFRTWCKKGGIRARLFVVVWLVVTFAIGIAYTAWECAKASYEAATDEDIWPVFAARCREAWRVFVTGKFQE